MGVSSEWFSLSVFRCLSLFLFLGFFGLVLDFVCLFSWSWFRFVILLAIRPPVLSSNPPLSFIPPMTMIDRKALQAHAFATKPAKPQGGGSR